MNKDFIPALEELSAVLKKHDMAGLIVLANSTHVIFQMELEASWNCIRIEREPDGTAAVRIRSKASEYPTREAQHKTLEVTVGTFVSLHDTLDRLSAGIGSILVTLSKHVEFIGRSITEE